MIYAKIHTNGDISISPKIKGGETLEAILIADGFVPYEEEELPDESELSSIGSYKLCYRQEEGQIVGYYEVVDVDLVKVNTEIERLKLELTATDYKVVKNQELQMVGEACAYDPHELYEIREPLREAIRELEIYLT